MYYKLQNSLHFSSLSHFEPVQPSLHFSQLNLLSKFPAQLPNSESNKILNKIKNKYNKIKFTFVSII